VSTTQLTTPSGSGGRHPAVADVRRLNNRLGEQGFTGLFWLVIVGYTARLAGGL
jgi:hypothetical protein